MAYPNGATKNLTAQVRFKGGVASRTLAGAVTCDRMTETFCFWDPAGASRDVTLPAEEESDGLFFFVKNEADAAENLVIKDDGGSTIVTVNQGEWAIVACNGSAWQDIPFSALADYLATANTWSAEQTFGAGIALLDSDNITLGTGDDDTIGHDGTNTTWTHAVGDLIFDNTDVDDQIIFRVGTDTSATGMEFRNNSDVAVWAINPSSATAGTLKGLDGSALVLGTGNDDSVQHNGTNTIWTHATGNLVFDNTLATGATYMDLGTDTSATEWGVRNNSGTRLFHVTGDGQATVSGGLRVTGKLALTGSAVLVDAEHVDLRANYQYQNTDYTTAVAQTGGLVVNYLPTATVDTANGAVVAGVDGVSDPTIATTGAATFAATDLVMISGSANNGENDGLYEVQGHAGNVLTLKSTSSGITNRAEDFTLDQLVANAAETFSITKVTVTVLRTGSDGIWEVGSGSQTGISYSNLVRASDAGSVFQAYDATLASIAALGTAADRLAYTTGIDTWAETALTAFGRSIIDDVDEATFKATVNLEIGVDVQAYDAELAALSAAATGLCFVDLQAAAEAGNAIAVTVNLKDAANANLSRAQRLHCRLYDANMLEAVVASFTMAETGAGTEISGTGQPALLIDTDANGDAVVTVTDVSGVFAGTVYLEVTPVIVPGSVEPGVAAIIALVFA